MGFSQNEYITFLFSSGEEHLIPLSLLRDSEKIQEMLASSHDNTLHIKDIASETLSDLVDFIARSESPSELTRLHSMIKGAGTLGLSHVEQKLTQIAKSRFTS